MTFVGGEPFAQARPLALLGRKLRSSGLSVVTFTGYTYERILSANRDDWNELLAETDLLIDGPFILNLKQTRLPWIGSSNQQYRFLTSRYEHLRDRLDLDFRNKLEIRLLTDGSISVNGLANTDDIDLLFRDIAKLEHTSEGPT